MVLPPPPTTADLDLVRDQYRSELQDTLASLDIALSETWEPEGLGSDDLHLARARVLRLRGQYADARAELDHLSKHVAVEQFMLRMWIWFERSMITIESDTTHNMLPAWNLDRAWDEQLEYIDISVGRPPALIDFVTDLEREQARGGTSAADTHQAQAQLVSAMQLVGLLHVLVSNHLRFDRLTASEDPVDQVMKGLLMFVPKLSVSATDEILTPRQRDELLVAHPGLEHGRKRDCTRALDPWSALHCAEALLFAEHPVTLGLSSVEARSISNDPARLAEVIQPSAEDRVHGRALLEQARLGFSEKDHRRGLARVMHVSALLELRALMLGEDLAVETTRGHLEAARRMAASAGDRKLEVEVQAHLAFLAALNHDRQTAESLISGVVDHSVRHQDHGMAASLGWTALELGTLQIRRRADLIAGELLLVLGTKLYDNPLMVAATHVEVASMYRRARALHQAAHMLAVARELQVRHGREHGDEDQLSIWVELLRLREAIELHVARSDTDALRNTVAELDALVQRLPYAELGESELAAMEHESTRQLQRDARSFRTNLAMQFLESMRDSSEPGHSSAVESLLRPRRLVVRFLEHIEVWKLASARWLSVRLAGVVRPVAGNSHIELALLEEQQAILDDPDRSSQLAARLNGMEVALARHRPDVLAKLMHADGRDQEAIEMLVWSPGQEQGSNPDIWSLVANVAAGEPLNWTLAQAVARPSNLALRFRALVELGAHAQAGVLLSRLTSSSGKAARERENEDEGWKTVAAIIRWGLVRAERDVVRGHVEQVEEELQKIDSMRDMRLHRGSLTRQGFSTAVAAAADSYLMAGDNWAAAEMMVRAQPSGRDLLDLGSEGMLAELATRHDILLAERDDPGCATEACQTELDVRIMNVRGEYEAMTGWPIGPPMAKPELRSLALQPGQAILTYFVSERAVHTVLLRAGHDPHITRHDVEYFRMRGRIQRLGSWLSRGLANRWTEPDLEYLSEILVPDALQLEGIDRLIVVPHDILADVPFALLPFDVGTLSETMELVELPSLELYDVTPARARPGRLRSRVLVAGDLDLAQFEAQELRQTLRTKPARATSDGFLAALRSPRVDLVHVIAHGQSAEDGHPASLEFDDGSLGADQLLTGLRGEPISARYIVFSTCEVGSARGSLDDPGFRFGATLLRHGVEQVIVPLWRVEDSTRTARFWQLFYTAMDQERTMVEALHRAQGAARAEGLPPAVWAAFKIISRS